MSSTTMSLKTGDRLGPYEIQSLLGTGGMGEVYRARDPRLARDVAIKVLPSGLSSDPERLRRFEQEARAVAALNHPNILALYEIGTENGTPFLVTELLDGETLRERLLGGALPLRKAVDIAVQTAHATAAAHEKGIIHRDLKPANIFLTHDGRVKVLDFGLARIEQRGAAEAGASQSPTRTVDPQTGTGLVLGTAGYMSPEQVRGKPADARSDIFALGTVLYEMLSGQRAFQKDSSADTMAAILNEEPPELSRENNRIPLSAERIVQHCMEKNPAERFQSARDLAFNLQALSATSKSETISATPIALRRHTPLRVLATAFAAAGLVAAGAAVWFLTRSSTQVSNPTYHQLTFDRGLVYAARFVPGSQTIIYSAAWNERPLQIYSTTPDSPEWRPLGLGNASLFAVSSSQMAISVGCRDLFIADCEGTLALTPLSVGAPREIATNVVSADWVPGGSDMGAIREVEGHFQVEFPLGRVIYTSGTWLDSIRISPRGDVIGFVQYGTGGDHGQTVIVDRDGKVIARSRMFPSVEGALAWTPSGKEVWFGATVTHAWPNAIHSLGLDGRERVVLRLPGMLRLADISSQGQVLLTRDIWYSGMQFRGANDTRERDVSWLDAAVLSDLSPDGQQLAFGEYGEAAGQQLIAYMAKSASSGPPTELGRGYTPVFSPDGMWVLVSMPQPASTTPGHLALLPTGAGQIGDLNAFAIQQFSDLGWMPDGKEIYFAGNDGHDWHMYLQDLSGGKPRAITPPITVTPFAYVGDLVSADGKFCFAHDLNGKGWLYPLDGGPPKPIAGIEPDDVWVNWSGDGRSGYVYQNEQTHAQIFRLDLATGKRKVVAVLAPKDPVGLVGIVPVRITQDGKNYAYSYNRSLSDLFLVDGVK